LWDAVVTARTALAHERHLRQGPAEAAAREDLLDALEAYIQSLEARGYPTPYALRDELRLQRIACSAGRYVRPKATYENGDRGRSAR
jgi:hypothetical protein